MNQSFTPREFIDKINAENPGPAFDPYGVDGLIIKQQEDSAGADLLARAKTDASIHKEKWQRIEAYRAQADEIINKLRNESGNLGWSYESYVLDIEIYEATNDSLLRDELIGRTRNILSHSSNSYNDSLQQKSVYGLILTLAENDELDLALELCDLYDKKYPDSPRESIIIQIAEKGDIERAVLLAEAYAGSIYSPKDDIYSFIVVELIKNNNKDRALELIDRISSDSKKSITFSKMYKITNDSDYILKADKLANGITRYHPYEKTIALLEIYIAKKDRRYLDDVLFYLNDVKTDERESLLSTIGAELAKNDFDDDALDMMNEIRDAQKYTRVYAEIAKSFARNGKVEEAKEMLNNIEINSHYRRAIILEIIKGYMAKDDVDNAKGMASETMGFNNTARAWAVIAKSLYEKANNLEGSFMA
jgi:hypothetical protein